MKHPKHAIYAAALWELMRGARSEEEKTNVAKAFAAYLSERRCAGLLPKIHKELESIEQRKNGIVPADIVSAVALTENEKDAAVRAIAAAVKKEKEKIDARFAVDDALIGGLVARTPEIIIDGTVRTKLEKLKKALTV